jgi:WD40 repeat protein
MLAAVVAAISVWAAGCSGSAPGGPAVSATHAAGTSPPPTASPLLTRPATGSLIGVLNNPNWSSTSLAFSPDGKRLAVGTAIQAGPVFGGYAYLWDVATRKLIATFAPQAPLGVDFVAFSPDGRTLAFLNGAGDLETWDVGSDKQDSAFENPGHDSGFNAAASAPDSQLIAVADNLGAVYLWNPDTQILAATLTHPYVRSATALAWDPRGGLLAVSDEAGDVYVWDTGGKTLLTGVTVPDGGQVTSLAYTPDGAMFAAGTTNGDVYLYDTTSYRLQGTLTAAGSNAVTALAYAPGGVILAVGYASGTTALWDTATQKATANLVVPGSGNAVKGLAFAPDASLLAVANQARSTYLWRITQLP